MFEQPGIYQLEMNKQRKARVTVKNAGRIGGGFMGHAAKWFNLNNELPFPKQQ